jgi:hypothetical protein
MQFMLDSRRVVGTCLVRTEEAVTRHAWLLVQIDFIIKWECQSMSFAPFT